MAIHPWSRIQNSCVRSGPKRHGAGLAPALFGLILWSLGAVAASAQPVQNGVAYLVGGQAADGSWTSSQVRDVQATTEALRALQVLKAAPASRQSAVTRLETDPIL